jgi:Domain of unknown function (DUF5615)
VKVRFLADADLNKAIVSGLLRREPSIDFLTANAAGLRNMGDAEVLALAADRQRVLVSHDVGTMPSHFRAHLKVETVVPVFSLSLRVSTLERRYPNSYSSGWHRTRWNGKAG